MTYKSSSVILCTMCAVAIVCCDGAAQAQTLVYSYEIDNGSGPDQFFGLGTTVTQEPVLGVTHLESSMKIVAGNGGFVAARTETNIPPQLNDPPGVRYVLFDMYIPEAYPGTFADIGVTVFGHDLDSGTFGHQAQFADTESIAVLGPGQHNNLKINLDFSMGPIGVGESFNDIFGPDPNDLDVASAFQFYISKNVGIPVTVYIDNVRLAVPEPAAIALVSMGAVLIGALRRRY